MKSSTKALKQLKTTFPEAADASATVLITVPEGKKLEDADVKAAIETWTERLEELDYVNGLIGPFSEHVDGLISPDGASGRANVRVDGVASTITDEQRDELTTTAKTLEQDIPGTTVLVGGEVFSIHVPRISAVEALGLAVAVVVLILTLGSIVASMMPVGTAIAGVGLGVLAVQIASGVITVSSTTLILALMLGLAVGIDYALFIISRHRDQLAAAWRWRVRCACGGHGRFGGGVRRVDRSHRAGGLSLAGLPFLTVMGVFGAVTVALEVVLALTLLPAFMGFAGERLRPR